MERGEAMMSEAIRELRAAFGGMGLAALAVLAGVLVFFVFVLRPLETRGERLKEQLAAGAARTSSAGAGSPGQTAEKLAALYEHLQTREQTTDLLARLYAAGNAAGVDLRAADYRLQQGGARIERYEITLPVAGSYPQIRTFLGKALADIPALSLDKVSFRKQRANDAQVQADMHLTFHIVRP
jgi:Tfp pilus assembly protein PilO